MKNAEELVRLYLATWNETSADARRKAIGELWAETCTYTDPNAAVRGRDGIDGFIDKAPAI